MAMLGPLIEFWRGFDLASLQKSMDEAVGEIALAQDKSSGSRAGLIGLTKEFREKTDEALRASAGPLIKAFQAEVDRLEARSQAAERAFFVSYQALAKLQDPMEALNSAANKISQLGSNVQALEMEKKTLKEALDVEAKANKAGKERDRKLAEVQSLLAQYDRNIDQTMQDRVAEVSARLAAEADNRVRAAEEARDEAERRLASAEARMRADQGRLELNRSELFEAAQKAADQVEAKSGEVELLLEDLDKANQRSAFLEKQVELLANKKNISMEQDPAQAAPGVSGVASDCQVREELEELEKRCSVKEAEIARLVGQLEKISADKEAMERANEVEVGRLVEAQATLRKRLADSEEALEKQSDYEAIKRELKIVRSLEFSEGTVDDSEEDAAGVEGSSSDEAAAAAGNHRKPVEILIMERNKALQSENTGLRMGRDSLARQLGRASEELESQKGDMARQAALIAELESHVEELQKRVGSGRGEAEGRSSTEIWRDEISGFLNLQVVDDPDNGGNNPQEPWTAVVDHHRPASAAAAAAAAAGDQGFSDQSNLLPIFQAQRERFRKRNEELEEANALGLQQVAHLQEEVRQLSADNLKLYEKIKFLQGCSSYQQQQQRQQRLPGPVVASSVATPASGGATATAINLATTSAGFEAKYQNQYEHHLDPFTRFSKQERQRRYERLNIPERIILWMVRLALNNKVARLAAFLYVVVLHVLTFFVLTSMVMQDSEMRDLGLDWEQKYLLHMQDHHGPDNDVLGQHHKS